MPHSAQPRDSCMTSSRVYQLLLTHNSAFDLRVTQARRGAFRYRQCNLLFETYIANYF